MSDQPLTVGLFDEFQRKLDGRFDTIAKQFGAVARLRTLLPGYHVHATSMKYRGKILTFSLVYAGEPLKERERAFIYAHDLELLNRAADRLKAEAEETLEYQADPWRPEME